MDQEIIKGLVRDLAEVESKVTEAQEVINILKEAGEQTADLEAQLRGLVTRRNKWQRVLKARGYVK